ncbi:MAG TPA: MliC family protein [Crinalium sp.]|jgi:membrane-bound inhibitor of C-type lysozyme
MSRGIDQGRMMGAIATLTILIGGCSRLFPSQNRSQERVAINPASTVRTYVYQCSNSQTFEATFLQGSLLLRLPNQPEVTLAQEATESGRRYSNGQVTFSTAQDNSASIDINGQRAYQACIAMNSDQPITPGVPSPSEVPSPNASSSPQATASPIANQTAQEEIVCRTANYFANLSWAQGQPLLTFGDGRQANLVNNAPVTVAQTSDGGTIYTTTGNTAASMAVYSNGSCVLQLVSSNGTVNVNQLGQVSTGNIENSETYQDGFNRGYRVGYQSGQNYRIYNYAYNPNQAFGQTPQSGDVNYDEGFRRGFYAGFDAGYYSINSSKPNPGGSNTPINGLW